MYDYFDDMLNQSLFYLRIPLADRFCTDILKMELNYVLLNLKCPHRFQPIQYKQVIIYTKLN